MNELSPDLVGQELPSTTVSWDKPDVLLYALGVGARPDNGLDYIYEGRGPAVLPTFSVIPGMKVLEGLTSRVPLDLSRLLHGEQGITLHRPLPPRVEATLTGQISEVWDKGKAAVIGVTGTCEDADGPLFDIYASLFVLGGGGFGGDRGPSSSGENDPPDREPDHLVEDITRPEQAALYRLSGDRNPMHIDPDFATKAGFAGPFLHGLCTFGFVGRAVLATSCGGSVERFGGLRLRFADQVWPGDTVITRIWDEPGGAVLEARTQTDNVVLTQARAIVHPV